MAPGKCIKKTVLLAVRLYLDSAVEADAVTRKKISLLAQKWNKFIRKK